MRASIDGGELGSCERLLCHPYMPRPHHRSVLRCRNESVTLLYIILADGKGKIVAVNSDIGDKTLYVLPDKFSAVDSDAVVLYPRVFRVITRIDTLILVILKFWRVLLVAVV